MSVVGSYRSSEKLTPTFCLRSPDFYRVRKCEISPRFSTRSGTVANVVSPVDCGRPRRGLRSSSSSDFSLPPLRPNFGKRAFTYAGPSAWNSRPNDLRAVTDPGLFRKQLKTHFLPCDCEAYARFCCRDSVRLSVRPSVCQTRVL